MSDQQRPAGFPPVDEQWMVYLVVNGSLQDAEGNPTPMSAGKIGSQAAQVMHRLLRAADRGEGTAEQRAALAEWERVGTRTLVRVAETLNVWERCKNELDCVVLVDAGLTEVAPGSETILACWPVQRRALPRMLAHKRCPLLQS